jgi:hypothetical protein
VNRYWCERWSLGETLILRDTIKTRAVPLFQRNRSGKTDREKSIGHHKSTATMSGERLVSTMHCQDAWVARAFASHHTSSRGLFVSILCPWTAIAPCTPHQITVPDPTTATRSVRHRHEAAWCNQRSAGHLCDRRQLPLPGSIVGPMERPRRCMRSVCRSGSSLPCSGASLAAVAKCRPSSIPPILATVAVSSRRNGASARLSSVAQRSHVLGRA